jgi:preprotein translocase subunit Sss1
VSPGTTRTLVVVAVGITVVGIFGIILYLTGLVASGNP